MPWRQRWGSWGAEVCMGELGDKSLLVQRLLWA